MNTSILIKFKSFLYRNIFLGSLIFNSLYIFWHYLGMPVYYIYFFLRKPYIGGYFCTDQERFRQRYKMLKKSLKYLIDNFYTDLNETINVLEIGTCAGGSTLQICNFFRNNNITNFKIYCVDHWKSFPASQVSWSFQVYILNRGLENGKIFKIFKDNIKFSACEKNIEVLTGSSKEVLTNIKNLKFDFIYIDGGHGYPIIHSDIKMSIDLLKDKSLISGDDYEVTYKECDQQKIKNYTLDEKLDFCLDQKSNKVYHPGVTMAVNDFFGNIPSHNGFWVQKKINKKFENVDLLNF